MALGALDCVAPPCRCCARHGRVCAGIGGIRKLPRQFARSPGKMKSDKSMATAPMDMDRRPIRVDLPPEHAGVMAALRRAFQAAADAPSDRDFADLLRKLN